MRWEHEWGSRLKTLLGHAEKTGKTPQSVTDAPQAVEWAAPILEAFYRLSRYRPLYAGFGAAVYGAIPLSEIIAYMDSREIVGSVERLEWLEILQALDDEYLTLVNTKETSNGSR